MNTKFSADGQRYPNKNGEKTDNYSARLAATTGANNLSGVVPVYLYCPASNVSVFLCV